METFSFVATIVGTVTIPVSDEDAATLDDESADFPDAVARDIREAVYGPTLDVIDIIDLTDIET